MFDDLSFKHFSMSLSIINIVFALISLLSFGLGEISLAPGSGPILYAIPQIFQTVLYIGLIFYWRFWFIFVIPSIGLNFISEKTANNRYMALNLISMATIIWIQFAYGFQLPD